MTKKKAPAPTLEQENDLLRLRVHCLEMGIHRLMDRIHDFHPLNDPEDYLGDDIQKFANKVLAGDWPSWAKRRAPR